MKISSNHPLRKGLCFAQLFDCLICTLLLGTILAAIFSVSAIFPDKLIDAKYFFTWGMRIITCITISLRIVCTKKRLPLQTYYKFIEFSIVLACTFQALFFLVQTTGIILPYCEYGVGSFENTAGLASCLSISLPISWNLTNKNSKIKTILLYISKAICIIAIVYSQSRTGIICIIVFTFLRIVPKDKWKWLGVIIPLLFFTILFYKSDSSKGRWFILQRSIEMIWLHPWFGYGKGGFEAHYMDIQATYFMRHPFSEYGMLADNIKHPLNEWIAATIDFGLIGLFVIVSFFASTIRYANKHPSKYSSQGLMILIGIGIFSCFSYPFQYPFTWLMLIFSLCCIYNISFGRFKKPLAYLVIFGGFGMGYLIGTDCKDNIKLEKMQEKSNCGLSKRILPQYKSLYHRQRHDCRFLFYYAYDLYLAEQTQEALKKAKECHTLLADYELNLLTGDIFKSLGQKDSSLHYYRHAHYMCPSRLTPLYEMYRVCKEYKDTMAYTKLRYAILHKPIKVKSKETERIIQEIKNEPSI